MSYGINIFSDSGKIAFSTDYQSYRLLGKYTVTRTLAAQTYGNFCSLTITSYTTPICFVKPNYDLDYVAVDNMSNSGTSWTIQFSSESIQSSSATLVIYVFTADNELDSGYGINVWDSSSNVTFSTKHRTLKLSGWIISNAFTPSTLPQTISLTSGTIPTNFAVNAPALGWIIRFIGPTAFVLSNIGINKQSSTTGNLDSARFLIQFLTASPSVNIFGNIYIMYIDSSLYD